MAESYTRQSTFSNGDVIDAPLFNAEFDQLQLTFDATTGHTHDGSPGQGAPVSLIQKGTSGVYIDTTNPVDHKITFKVAGVTLSEADSTYFTSSPVISHTPSGGTIGPLGTFLDTLGTDIAATLVTANGYTDTTSAATLVTAKAYTDAEVAYVVAATGFVPSNRTINGYDLTVDLTLTAGDVGLSNVDNTSDSAKQSATLSAATKSDVGLSNVDNTSDTNKPISNAQATALNLKANSSALGTSAALNVTTSATDTTAGRINKNGDHGIGIDSASQAYSDWLLVPWSIGGKYAIDIAATNRPAGITAGFYVAETIGFVAGTALLRPAGGGNIYHVRVDNPLTAPTFSVIQEILTSSNVTTSSTDTTTGRVTKVGDFGPGSTNLSTITGSVLNTGLATGFYRYALGTTTDLPSGTSYGEAVVINSEGGSAGQIILYDHDNDLVMLNRKRAGAYQGWNEILTTASATAGTQITYNNAGTQTFTRAAVNTYINRYNAGDAIYTLDNTTFQVGDKVYVLKAFDRVGLLTVQVPTGALIFLPNGVGALSQTLDTVGCVLFEKISSADWIASAA